MQQKRTLLEELIYTLSYATKCAQTSVLWPKPLSFDFSIDHDFSENVLTPKISPQLRLAGQGCC